MSATEEEKNKKFNQKFKNIFSQSILSSKWEKEGIEVRNYIYYNKNI